MAMFVPFMFLPSCVEIPVETLRSCGICPKRSRSVVLVWGRDPNGLLAPQQPSVCQRRPCEAETEEYS